MAYKILSDPTKREYDKNSVDGVDKVFWTPRSISARWIASTLVASMISSLGVNIKTAVPMKVLESVRSGKVAIAVDVGCKLRRGERSDVGSVPSGTTCDRRRREPDVAGGG